MEADYQGSPCCLLAKENVRLIKYVFIQDEPYFLPKVLDKYLREFHDSTAGINIQSVAQGKRTVFENPIDQHLVRRRHLKGFAGISVFDLSALGRYQAGNLFEFAQAEAECID